MVMSSDPGVVIECDPPAEAAECAHALFFFAVSPPFGSLALRFFMR